MAFKGTARSILSDKIENVPHFGDRKVGMTIVFRQSRPTSRPYWVGSQQTQPASSRLKKAFASIVFPTSSGDIDNLQKFVFDALSDVAYADDGQVVTVCGCNQSN